MILSQLCLAFASCPGGEAPISGATEPSRPQIEDKRDPRGISSLAGSPKFTISQFRSVSPPRAEKAKDLPNSSAKAPEDRLEGESITVVGRKSEEAVRGNVRPIRSLNPIDIRAFGSSSVQELLGALRNDLTSNKGTAGAEPIVLVNGRRVSSLIEIARYPSESIERVEIFPEEVAQNYGFTADQKVVNLVLFKRFNQKSLQSNVKFLSEGGGLTTGLSAQLLSIVSGVRYNASAQASQSADVNENQRNLGRQQDTLPGDASNRTLVPKLTEFAARAGVAGPVLDHLSGSLTAGASHIKTKTALGVIGQSRTSQKTSSSIIDFGSTLDGGLGTWQWANTMSYKATYLNAAIVQDDTAENVVDKTRSHVRLLTTDLTLSGNLLRLPAGSIGSTFRVAHNAEKILSPATYRQSEDPSSLGRVTSVVFGALSIPFSRRASKNFWHLGNLSAGAQLRFEAVQTYKDLFDYGVNISWTPRRSLSFFVSKESQSTYPSLLQLASPLISIPNLRIFDFSRLATTSVAQVFGGNPDLQNERRSAFDLRMTIRPMPNGNMYAALSYSNFKINNRIVNFPIVTSALQAALPSRFSLAEDGGILGIDARPINISESATQKFGINLSWTSPMGKASSASEIGINPNPGGPLPADLVPPDAKVVYAPPGTPLPPDLINALSRLFVNLNYTFLLRDRLRITQNSEQLSLLDGFALSRSGGSPRHDLRLSAGVFRRGLGLRGDLSLRSDSSITYLESDNPRQASSLRFRYKPILNLQIFLNPQDRIVGNVPNSLQNLQISLRIDNAFASRPKVVDETGNTPFLFKPAFLDPLGRSVSLTARKVF